MTLINGVAPYTMVDKTVHYKYVARMNLYSVKSNVARVSLMRGDKNSAIQYAKEVVESENLDYLIFASTDKSEKEIDILFQMSTSFFKK